MGWSIYLEKNTVVIPPEAGEDEEFTAFAESNDCELYEKEDGTFEFSFCDDHMEHMDYMWNDEVSAFGLKYKLNGDVCFSSTEGDNAGEAWGYRFKDGALIGLGVEKQWVELQTEAA